MSLTVSSLHLYPVKSLAGITLQHANLTLAGLHHDRNWMVVKDDGTFVTQRSHPQMALIETAIENDLLVLSCFGMEPHQVPATNANMQQCRSNVWGDDVVGLDVGDDTSVWLSQAIGDRCRLIAFPASEFRPCNPEVAREGDHTKFADGFPLLIVSDASLLDLNNRLTEPVKMNRFRPNIVVQGCEPFAEDSWQEIRVNETTIRLVEGCARCSVPTVNPETGILSGPEPIHTLSSYRERDGEVYFGVNAIPNGEGMIRVGDAISIIN